MSDVYPRLQPTSLPRSLLSLSARSLSVWSIRFHPRLSALYFLTRILIVLHATDSIAVENKENIDTECLQVS